MARAQCAMSPGWAQCAMSPGRAGCITKQIHSTPFDFSACVVSVSFLERNANHLFQQFTGLNARCRWAGLNARCRRAGLAVLCHGCIAPLCSSLSFSFLFKPLPLSKPSPLSPYPYYPPYPTAQPGCQFLGRDAPLVLLDKALGTKLMYR